MIDLNMVSVGQIKDSSKIFNRLEIISSLKNLKIHSNSNKPIPRKKYLGFVKKVLNVGRMKIHKQFEKGSDGREVVSAQTYLIDQIIYLICKILNLESLRGKESLNDFGLAIVAVGGYGRGELAPFSDVDLLFLISDSKKSKCKEFVRNVLYFLWDLDLKIGHATRTIEESIQKAKEDIIIRTSLLESRIILGDRSLYEKFLTKFDNKILKTQQAYFIKKKLSERDERHLLNGDARYLLEPNIKDGKGGIRDINTLFWITRYVYREPRIQNLVSRKIFSKTEMQILTRAYNFLLTLRCHIHFLINGAEERLTFDIQPEISRRMGYTDHAGTLGVERLMKHYYLVAKQVGDLTRIFCAAIESENLRSIDVNWRRLISRKKLPQGFKLIKNRLTINEKSIFSKKPINMLRLFHISQNFEIDIHPSTLRLINQNLKKINKKFRENKEVSQIFLEILTSSKHPEVTLMRMNESGILGKLIPDFGRIVGHMQFDMYHVYTVDQHTIRAIGILAAIERGEMEKEHPLATEVFPKVKMRRCLYVALFLHDIAKGRGGDHSLIGSDIAKKLSIRLGMSSAEAETVSWLVENHLLMSMSALQREVSDAKTVEDFSKSVQSPERLRLLLILTIADIKAVGPNTWNSWKAGLIRALYSSSEDLMSGGFSISHLKEKVENSKKILRKQLMHWPSSEFKKFSNLGYSAYWMSQNTDAHIRQAKLIRKAEKHKLDVAVNIEVNRRLDITYLTVYTADHPGLFYRICKAIASVGGNIVDAKIFTMANGSALDEFSIQSSPYWLDGDKTKAFDDLENISSLKQLVVKSVTMGNDQDLDFADQEKIFPRHKNLFSFQPQIHITNDLSNSCTVVEINGIDRSALLYDLTKTFTDQGLQIVSAKISTYGAKAVDVFYVKDIFGSKIENKNKIKRLQKSLMNVLRKNRNQDQKYESTDISEESSRKIYNRRKKINLLRRRIKK